MSEVKEHIKKGLYQLNQEVLELQEEKQRLYECLSYVYYDTFSKLDKPTKEYVSQVLDETQDL